MDLNQSQVSVLQPLVMVKLFKATLPRDATILSAELYAITIVINKIKRDKLTHGHKVLICSDSLTSINMLQNSPSSHPLVRRLQHDIHNLNTMLFDITFLWVPSHCGVEGNELADTAAQSATTKTPQNIPIIYSDYYSSFLKVSKDQWNYEWQSSNTKMKKILPELKPFPKLNINRKKHIILNRLRTGHTNITHQYLLDSAMHPFPPVCHFCMDSVLTMEHILQDCTAISQQRADILGNGEWTSLLFEGDDRLFAFLHNIDAIDNICCCGEIKIVFSLSLFVCYLVR